MSQGESEPGVAKRVMRTVTPEYWGRPDSEMTTFGWAYFLGLVILLVPLLPFIVILWLGDRLMAFVTGRGEDSPESQGRVRRRHR